ncbi:hypothetical protein SteCoe_8582 [Stentor coeruleus]|uniref:Uncharacterized protein n=1 Tax=Stentor coeruleus TaxID=5963 RepID=A0A1R2CK07_9CILI|nr:hypothetical protein SteCoe_8582 [Stentor coeruleus]
MAKFPINSNRAFKTEVAESPNISRPMSTVPKHKKNSLSYRQSPQINKKRCTSASKDQTSRCQSYDFDQRSILGLSFFEIRQIYSSKCEDLCIPSIPDQEKKFFNYCWLHFKDRYFNLSESGIGPLTAKQIGKILKTNPNFAYLDLSKNSIKDQGTIELLKSLKNSFNVVHLDISSNDITPEGSREIFKILEENESLISLNISSHEGLGIEGGESLMKILATNKIISYLNVSGTSLGPEGLNLLLKGLESNVTLSSLNLAGNFFGSKPIEKLAITIVGTDIRELNISNNKIGNEGCEYLSLMLSGNYDGYCTITKLDISDNEITTKGLGSLLASVRINNQLTHLYLRKNSFSKGLSENFFDFLTDNTTLESLDFTNCDIKCECLGNIGEGLGKNKCLKNLVFAGNKIKDRGVEMIGYGLNKNKFLKVLDLSSNEIKNKGAIILAKTLRVNSVLESLLLKDNSIKDSGGQSLCESLRYNQNILRITLDLNPLNYKFISEIKEFLQNNNALKKKSLVPKLQVQVVKTSFDIHNIDNVHQRIQQKVKEKQDAEIRLRNQSEKLEGMKEAEKLKFNELRAEYNEIKSKSYGLSAEIDTILSQINRVRFQGEKNISEMSTKISQIASQTKQAEKMRKKYLGLNLKEKVQITKAQSEFISKQFQDEMFQSDMAKKIAETYFRASKAKILEMKNELQRLKNPVVSKAEVPKNFLASEKLASAKKSRSFSVNESKRRPKTKLKFTRLN